MDKIQKVAAAQILGQQAFVNGKPRIPALDSQLLKLLEGTQVGEGIPISSAWLKGWDDANLCADRQ